MIEITKKVNDIFKALYEGEGINVSLYNSYDQIMESNESRLDYLNHLFEKINANELGEECTKIFKENIDFIHSFMKGEYNTEFTVSKKFYEDSSYCLIIPNPEDLEYLFELFELNKKMFDNIYKNNKFIVDLPKISFNQNMTRILEVRERNLSHLLGLTDSEYELNPKKNLLKKHFINNIEKNKASEESEAVRLFNWVLSDEGKEELRRLNNITINFIKEDKFKYSSQYDKEGNIKQRSLRDFQKRFKENTGYDFPIIKFSRYLTKSINTLNFLSMNNIFQMILDYNAPKGKKDEKDIFIVNTPIKLMAEEIKRYLMIDEKILEFITVYAKEKEDDVKDELELFLREIGINFDEEEFTSFINLIESYDFVGKQGINPNQTIALVKIRDIISEHFARNIHMIGFGTDFDGKNVELEQPTINSSHCDTSISLTAAELVGEYYHRGRPFFLDKIYSGDGKTLLRISNPMEELFYYQQMEEIEPYNLIQSQSLNDKLLLFEEKYKLFKNIIDTGKKL